MKKLFFSSILIFLLFGSLHAQTDPARVEQDHIFQHINKSLIPSGYLKEYGAELTPLHRLNGLLTDSNMMGNLDALRLAYTDLATAKIWPSLIQNL